MELSKCGTSCPCKVAEPITIKATVELVDEGSEKFYTKFSTESGILATFKLTGCSHEGEYSQRYG